MLGFLSGLRSLYVLVPMGLIAAAVVVPELNPNLFSDTGCASSEERPCYDQGTKKKVKSLKVTEGQNKFEACMSNGADNIEGTLSIQTGQCSEEIVTYCFLGKSDNFVRQFEGACEFPTPDLTTLNITGRFVDGVRNEPVADVRIWDPEVGVNIALDVSTDTGEFAFTTDTSSVTQTDGNYTGYTTGRCYFDNWDLTSIIRNTNQTLRLTATQFDFEPGDFVIDPITSPDIDIGDITLWPATGLFLTSDIPITYRIAYAEENKSLGSNQLSTAHKLSNVIPLEQPTIVQLTDGNGVTYTSPAKTYALSKGCSTAVLNFAGGEFTWND